MKKKVLILAAIMALQTSVQAAQKVFPEYEGNKIKIVLNTNIETGKNVAVSVIKTGADKKAENAFAVEEVVVDDKNQITLNFEMPDFRNNDATNGSYTIYAAGNELGEFKFASENTRNAFIDSLVNATSAVVVKNCFENSDNLIAAENLGIDTDLYNILTPAQKDEFAQNIFSQQRTKINVIGICKKELAYIIIKNYDEHTEEALTMLNMAYDNTNYNNITDASLKAFISDYFKAQKPEKTKYESEYAVANVLNKINNARYNEIATLITDNINELELFGDNTYVAYVNLSDSQKINVCENIVRILSTNKIKTKESFKNVLKTAIEQLPKGDNGYGGNSSSGGYGGSGGGSSNNKSSEGSSSYATTATIAQNGVTEDDFVFEDMTSHWAKTAVSYLYKKGIVAGVNNKEFNPNKLVTREEFVTMLVKAKGIELSGTCKFDDVDNNAWYAPYVATAFENKIVFGVSEKRFGVGEYITRQDMMGMISRVIEDDGTTIRSADEISDIESVSEYAKEAVKLLYSKGIISGTSDGKVEPFKNAARAEAAQIIYNIVNK